MTGGHETNSPIGVQQPDEHDDLNPPGFSEAVIYPRFDGVGMFDSVLPETLKGVRMPNPYPSEFRRKVLDLMAAGRSVVSISSDLGVSAQTINNWRRQELIDLGQAPGLSSPE